MTDKFILVNNNSPEWSEIYKNAQADKSHYLWENYQEINLDDYKHMIVNTRDSIPSAFHGIFNDGRWPDECARFCNRAYIDKSFRDTGQGLDITANNIKYVLDNYTHWNIPALFISRGVQYNDPHISWKKFEKFCKFVINKTGYNLTYDNYLYQCCPYEVKPCYQFCVWYDPTNIRDSLSINKLSINEWLRLETA